MSLKTVTPDRNTQAKRAHHRWEILAAGVFIFGIGMWWNNRHSPIPAQTQQVQSPSPASSHAARKLPFPSLKSQRKNAFIKPPEDKLAIVKRARGTEIVIVQLQHASVGLLMTGRHHTLDPATFWPLPDEASFPEGETADELQELIRTQAKPASDAERDWLDLAWQEGLSPDAVNPAKNPWAGVLALEVTRRTAREDQIDRYNDAIATGLGPQNGMITRAALVGPPEVEDQLALADVIIDANPDHPAAEFARLYTLQATAIRAQQGDIAEAWNTASDMLRNTDDALVLSQAVGILATLPGDVTLNGHDLDNIAEVLTDQVDLVDPIDVSVFALNQALKLEDGRRARTWVQRFETYLNEFCGNEPASPRCEQHYDNLDVAVAYIGDASTADARNWRQAIEIAAYHCARTGHLEPHMRLAVEVGWEEDYWQFGAWTPLATPMARCIENELPKGPKPERAPFDVRLTIVPPY